MAGDEGGEEDYSMLRDVRLSIDRDEAVREEAGFSLGLWIYLSSSARPSSLILRQTSLESEDEVPFLALSEENKLALFPLRFLHNGAPSADSSFPWSNIPHVSSENECPLEKWFHVGCEVTINNMRLYFNGELVGDMPLSSSDDHLLDYVKNVTVVGNNGKDDRLLGFVYNACVLPLSASLKDAFTQNQPVKLSLNGSCISEAIEVGSDGVWSIVGGKASCRRNFSLDVVLLDVEGQVVHKDMEVIASLVYADNGALVEKTQDNPEASLLTSCEGLEYPSIDKPVALFLGRATFKLKISQLSSKSDNRLFRVCFRASRDKNYPFLEACSPPIRCISRNRFVRPVVPSKRQMPTVLLPDKNPPEISDRPQLNNNYNGAFSKRLKVGLEKLSREVGANGKLEQNGKALKMSSEVKPNNFDGTDSTTPSDSESTDARNCEAKWIGESIDPTSDVVIFRYCIEGTYERSLLLKEIIKYSGSEELVNFSEQVCLYSGCLHHRYSILISKQLVHEGNDTWDSISKNGNQALWLTAAPEINKRFMSISRSITRGLSAKDMEVLRRIAGCGEELGQEHFYKMWHWLYPVAVALSKDPINALWECSLPRWIEGFITGEEAENSLKGSRGFQKAGTFVLRFPISRSWPHPDAGSLVVTYVGADSTVHHRLLSLDLSSNNKENGHELLQNMLLEESELSQLGRVVR
ncbi:hypothetical protein AXF42_Ash000968 [Apostasia shenzhenica]|uniref:SH2 domain-containing protein n=1 Tax=Apostasia shenzhenica TaxID=1088818 RepID=A0A2I0ATJ8_9ASPA|nr:hypothetical protein AXF42_Ash000968 [Apostasia shenzhenica]